MNVKLIDFVNDRDFSLLQSSQSFTLFASICFLMNLIEAEIRPFNPIFSEASSNSIPKDVLLFYILFHMVTISQQFSCLLKVQCEFEMACILH